jgi:PTH1 family peptidyl-tRNA hydrolase
LHLIVGLGNPGARYADTRHNIGWQVLDCASERWSISIRARGHARFGNGTVGSVQVALAAPLTWMNQTGPVVKALLEECNLGPGELVVIHDDLDLELGRLRIRRNGGSGGHNGILSILTALNTNDFYRLKVGIGRPAPTQNVSDYVLDPFASSELSVVDDAVEQAVLALECLVIDGATAAMNRFNVRLKDQEEKE